MSFWASIGFGIWLATCALIIWLTIGVKYNQFSTGPDCIVPIDVQKNPLGALQYRALINWVQVALTLRGLVLAGRARQCAAWCHRLCFIQHEGLCNVLCFSMNSKAGSSLPIREPGQYSSIPWSYGTTRSSATTSHRLLESSPQY